MSATFSRTLRSLDAGHGRRRTLFSLAATTLLAGWLVWFFWAEIPVHLVTDRGRLEVEQASHPIVASVAGTIVASRLSLGARVRTGDVLVQLDDRLARLSLEEARVNLEDRERRLEALETQMRAEESSASAEREATRAALAEAEASVAEARQGLETVEHELEVLERLAQNAVARESLVNKRAELAAARAALASRESSVLRVRQDRSVVERDREVRLAELRREATVLEGEARTAEAARRRLEVAVELHAVRAAIDGRIEEAKEGPVGAMVEAGGRLGAIVPPGEPRVVAWFPSTALGRVRPGQAVRLRSSGFPWTRFGTIPARVVRMAAESSDGKLRAEIAIEPSTVTQIPLQHGLPCTVEVEVERLAPFELVIRRIGRLLTTSGLEEDAR
ncbi:MAG: HlyD family efflux transporter periplasmic adaptor subunit [Planctomycetota bacterium]